MPEGTIAPLQNPSVNSLTLLLEFKPPDEAASQVGQTVSAQVRWLLATAWLRTSFISICNKKKGSLPVSTLLLFVELLMKQLKPTKTFIELKS